MNTNTYGDNDATPASIGQVSASASAQNNVLSSGYSSGGAYTGFQAFWGGAGNDTFQLRSKDFAGTGGVEKQVYDFHGAGGWNPVENDFLRLTNFGEGSTLTYTATKSVGADGATNDLYTIHSALTGQDYLIEVHSMNGQQLAKGDFAFY